MSVNQNQFAQSVVKGMVDLKHSPNTFSCRVASNETVALVPGQFVKLADVAGGAPVVTAITADTDTVFGVVSYNLRESSFAANASVEISSSLNVVYVEASAAIARGLPVMPVILGQKVAVATPTKSIVGLALDKATDDGDLIRIIVANIGERVLFPSAAVEDLDQTISVAYDALEVQAISDKVDELLASLRLTGVLNS